MTNSTGAIWLSIQRSLDQHVALGASEDGASAYLRAKVDEAMSLATHAVRYASQLANPGALLRAAHQELVQASADAVRAGFGEVAAGIDTLARRVVVASIEVSSAGANALHSFLGATPAQLGIGALVFGGVVLLGGAVLTLTPGGQAALLSATKLL
jgi:hypothetical protein